MKIIKSVVDMQMLAKETMGYIKSNIKIGQTLQQIKEMAETKMLELGADSFWYYGVGCLIYSDEDTTISVAGKKYLPANRKINRNSLITIDLSPQCKKVWGDYAETIIIQNGIVVNNVDFIDNKEWKELLLFEEKLHNELISFVGTHTTFEQLYLYMNDFILKNGFVNLDFINNLGHSIESSKRKRIYIEKNNKKLLSDVKYFTFEPHIGKNNCKYGVKKENIYYFANGKLKVI